MTEDSQAQRIGLLLVHGVGEQKRFQHLNGEVRDIVTALRRRWGEREVGEQRVLVRAATAPDGPFLAETQTWRAGQVPTVSVDLYDDDTDHPHLTHTLCFHEVWWADLDEAPERHGFLATLRWYGQFWYWGLSQWAVRQYAARFSKLQGTRTRDIDPPGNDARGHPPAPGFADRAKLFGTACFFLLLGVTWEALRFLGRRVNLAGPGSAILIRYVGDVKLYQDRRYHASPSVDGMVERPRVAIRQRMVRALAAMALADYDRWYVVAHSLGTVVAHNGLNELAETLPNYLDRETLDACQAVGIARVDPGADTSRRMMPLRPPWAGDGVVIDRARLFERLRGFLTYGSPLDKFATLWPAIVPQNRTPPAPEGGGLEWINVYDPMDSIAARLDFFAGSAPPQNLPYAADWKFLLAHIRYLKAVPDGLGERLVDWVTSGKHFNTETGTGPWLDAEATGRRRLLNRTLWGGITAFLGAAAAWAYPLLFHGVQEAATGCADEACGNEGWLATLFAFWQWFLGTLPAVPENLAGVVVLTVAVVLVLGLVRRSRQAARHDYDAEPPSD